MGESRRARRWVLHVDLDQFVVAVERLRKPELRGKPVIVGTVGDPNRRGVVSGWSYEARAFGVRSGMALREAKRRCPDAVFLSPDAAAYRAASRRTMSTIKAFPVSMEQAGWDEAFLGVSCSDPEELARKVQEAVRAETGLACSVGIGDTKVRAKMASALAKPGGIRRLTEQHWLDVVGSLPPNRLWGIGPRTQARLASIGIHSIGSLAVTDPSDLATAFGPNLGPHLAMLARGEGTSTVSPLRAPPRSHGHQTTFQHDVLDPRVVRRAVGAIAREIAGDLRATGRRATRLVVTVRYSPFDTHAHGSTLDKPTFDSGRMEALAEEALNRFDLDRPVRMVAVRAELAPASPDAPPAGDALHPG